MAMSVKFASHLNQEEQQRALDALMKALAKRNRHPFMISRLKIKSKQFVEILFEIRDMVSSGMSMSDAIDCWKGDLRKAMEWNTNIDYEGGLKFWHTFLAMSSDVQSRMKAAGMDKLTDEYAKGAICSVHEHLIVNMAIVHYMDVFIEGSSFDEAVAKVRTFLEKRGTVFITKDEEVMFNAIKGKVQSQKTGKMINGIIRESLNDRMSPDFDPVNGSPFDRYIAAGYDLTKFVINQMWLD